MACIRLYGSVSRNSESILFNDLLKRYGKERATKIYEEVIHSESPMKYSFQTWFNSLKDPFLTEQEEPTIETYDNWVKHVSRSAKLEKTYIGSDFILSPSEFNELSEGFSVYMIKHLLDQKGTSPSSLVDISSAQLRKVLDMSMEDVIDDLNYRVDNIDADLRVQYLLDSLEKDKLMFYEAFENYLRKKTSIGFNVENVLSEDIQENEDKETRDSAFDKSSIEFDTKDGAPNGIKVLIATLAKVEIQDGQIVPVYNKLGVPSLVDYNETFNYIQQKMLDVDPDINKMLDELTRLSKYRPEMGLLKRRLNFNNSNYSIPENEFEKAVQTELRSQFVNQFNKTKLDFALHIVNEDGTVNIINANQDNIRSKIINEWRAGFEVKLNDPDIVYKAQMLRKKKVKDILDFVGINLPPGVVADTELVHEFVKYGLDNEENIRNVFTRKSNVKGILTKLANLVITDGDNVVDFQQYNTENKLVYAITLNSYISSLAKKLSLLSGNQNELVEAFPELFLGEYAQDSIFLNKILEGKK